MVILLEFVCKIRFEHTLKEAHQIFTDDVALYNTKKMRGIVFGGSLPEPDYCPYSAIGKENLEILSILLSAYIMHDAMFPPLEFVFVKLRKPKKYMTVISPVPDMDKEVTKLLLDSIGFSKKFYYVATLVDKKETDYIQIGRMGGEVRSIEEKNIIATLTFRAYRWIDETAGYSVNFYDYLAPKLREIFGRDLLKIGEKTIREGRTIYAKSRLYLIATPITLFTNINDLRDFSLFVLIHNWVKHFFERFASEIYFLKIPVEEKREILKNYEQIVKVCINSIESIDHFALLVKLFRAAFLSPTGSTEKTEKRARIVKSLGAIFGKKEKMPFNRIVGILSSLVTTL